MSIQRLGDLAVGIACGALAVWLVLQPAEPLAPQPALVLQTPAQKATEYLSRIWSGAPERGMTVTRSPFRCGCPATNARGEEFEHCIRGGTATLNQFRAMSADTR